MYDIHFQAGQEDVSLDFTSSIKLCEEYTYYLVCLVYGREVSHYCVGFSLLCSIYLFILCFGMHVNPRSIPSSQPQRRRAAAATAAEVPEGLRLAQDGSAQEHRSALRRNSSN